MSLPFACRPCARAQRRFAATRGLLSQTVRTRVATTAPCLAAEAFELLRHYRWPGNVRELQSVLKQTILQTPGSVLLAENLPAAISSSQAGEPLTSAGFDWDRFVNARSEAGSEDLYGASLALMEREVLVRRFAAYERQSTSGRPHSGNHPRQPAYENQVAEHQHRALVCAEDDQPD